MTLENEIKMNGLPDWLIALFSGGAVLILRQIVVSFFKKKEEAEKELDNQEKLKVDSVLEKLDSICDHVSSMRTELTKLGEQTKTVFSRLDKAELELSKLRDQYIELLKK